MPIAFRLAQLALLVLACAPTPATQPSPATPEPTPTPVATSSPEPTSANAGAPVTVRDAEVDATWNAIGTSHTIAQKVVIGRYAALRFEPEGEVVIDGGGAKAFETLPVVAVQGRRIQIIAHADSSNTGVVVWIDEADVAPQLVRPAVLHDHATRTLKPGDGTLELAPGELIEILETKGDAARVRTRDGGLTGWIDAAALGPTWRLEPFALPQWNATVKPSTTVYVRPGGPALHKLPSMDGGEHWAHAEPAKAGWMLLDFVELCRPTIRVRGFVRSKTTTITLDPLHGGFGCGGGGRGSYAPPDWRELKDAPPVTLAKDTELLAADGKLVGRMRNDGDLRRGADGVLRLSTGWGLLPVHTKP
jgi:hypothetical protein